MLKAMVAYSQMSTHVIFQLFCFIFALAKLASSCIRVKDFKAALFVVVFRLGAVEFSELTGNIEDICTFQQGFLASLEECAK